MSLPAAHVFQLMRSLFEPRSLIDRFRGHDPRIATLGQIAQSQEIRVVPDLLTLLAVDGALAPHVGRTIAALAGDLGPAQLASIDETLRRGWRADHGPGAWRRLTPGAVLRLARQANLDVIVIGLIASHASGFVRAAALELLAQSVDGREIKFLSLRANDWVQPVATRSTELLIDRLRPDNRSAVLNALPFIVRVLAQHRRDHSTIEQLLRSVLLSDGGEDAVARGGQFETSLRRSLYELLSGDGTVFNRRVLDGALTDPDTTIRASAIKFLAIDTSVHDRAAMLEQLVRSDRVPAARRLALAAISEHLPERVAGLFPDVLLDRAASVRSLARFVATRHQLPLVLRNVYVEGLHGTVPTRISAAIEGVGETGTRADADLIPPFLDSLPGHRRSALRALGKLDAERAVSSAIAALADDSPSVRSAALDILDSNANRLDFAIMSQRLRALPDPRARTKLLRVFMRAPKWDVPAFLLEASWDGDGSVRASATRLLNVWLEQFNRRQSPPTESQLRRIRVLLDSVGARLPEETTKHLRFAIKV